MHATLCTPCALSKGGVIAARPDSCAASRRRRRNAHLAVAVPAKAARTGRERPAQSLIRATAFVLVPAKGVDRLFAFRFCGKQWPPEASRAALGQSRPAAGPRHLAFDRKLCIVWVCNELDGWITTYRSEGERQPDSTAGHHHTAMRFHGRQYEGSLPSRAKAARSIAAIAATMASQRTPQAGLANASDRSGC